MVSQIPDLESSDLIPANEDNCSQEELERLEELIATSNEGDAIAAAQEQLADCEAEADESAPTDAAPTDAAPTESPDAASSDEGIRISVTGTRTERPLLDSTASISILDRQQADRQQVQEIDDLVRYEPGVSVGNNLQYGLQGFNIRGIDGNRVLLQVDGIRLPTGFQSGSAVNIGQGFNIGRDAFETESLQRLEIIRGPASALYGSDALGGVVSYLTLDPTALLDAAGQETYSEISSSFNSVNQGYNNSVVQAFRGDDLDFLLSYTRRDGFTPENVGDNVYSDRTSLLGKLNYAPTDQDRFSFTGELFDNRVNFTTAEDNLPLISSTTSAYQEEIQTKRARLSAAYTYENDLGDRLVDFARAQLYWQNAETTEESTRDLVSGFFARPPAPFPARRVSANRLLDETLGGDLQFRSDFFTGETSHRLSYGIDLSTTFNSRPRDRVQTNLLTGVPTQQSIPDTFPLKDFPDTDTLRLGIYAQNEIEFAGDRWALIPGLRFDHYNLKTSSDEDFERNGAEAADFSGSSVSPSLGVLFRASDQISLFGRYARGFRAPLYNEINSGFSNQIFGYTTLPNPDLDAETSNSFELGVRGETDQLNFSLTGFYNQYQDFIAFQQVDVVDVRGRDFLIFQNRNVSNVRIYGIEAKGEYRFSPGPDGFSLLSSIGWTLGDDLSADEPLSSINPFEAVLGLRYQGPENRWGAELLGTYVGKARGNSLAGGNGFVPEAYGLVDLSGYVNLSSNFKLTAGVYNLLNTDYFRYDDVRFLDTEEALFDQRRDRREQPGTNFRVSVNLSF